MNKIIETFKKHALLVLPGMRVIKTFIAVVIAMTLSFIFKVGTPSSIGGIVIFSMANSVDDTKQSAKDRVIGTLLSGLFTFIYLILIKDGLHFVYLSPRYIIFGFLGLLLFMTMLVFVGIKGAFAYAIIVFVGIYFEIESYTPIVATVSRMVEAFIAIAVTLLVNNLKILDRMDERLKEQKGKIRVSNEKTVVKEVLKGEENEK